VQVPGRKPLEALVAKEEAPHDPPGPLVTQSTFPRAARSPARTSLKLPRATAFCHGLRSKGFARRLSSRRLRRGGGGVRRFNEIAPTARVPRGPKDSGELAVEVS
jgi:hypothetical protein